MDPTARIALGDTGLAVTRVGLGTAALGGLFEAVEEATPLVTVDRAYLERLRFFDTAPLYGHGLAERRLGRLLSAFPRDELVVAPKVGRHLRADAPPDDSQLSGGFDRWPAAPAVNPVFDFSYDGVMCSLEESLERLGLDRVYVLHIHDPDEHYDEALGGAYDAPRARARDVAMVFQNYALYPHMNVRDNLAYGLKMRKTPKPERRPRRRRATACNPRSRRR